MPDINPLPKEDKFTIDNKNTIPKYKFNQKKQNLRKQIQKVGHNTQVCPYQFLWLMRQYTVSAFIGQLKVTLNWNQKSIAQAEWAKCIWVKTNQSNERIWS